MSLQVSTRFKELLLGPNSFASIFEHGRILVYSGTQPISADAAATGTLLGTITAGGLGWAPGGSAGGLAFEQSGPFILRPATQPWRLTCTQSGIAGWFRLVGAAEDAGGLSYSHPRIDGAIGIGGDVEMTLLSTNLTSGLVYDIQQFVYTLPPIVGV